MNRINRIGRFLSNLVFQNIAGLVGLGLIRVLFSERGWFPIAGIDGIINPTLQYFLPILFAYTGGRMIGQHRGGVIASFVIVGLIAGNSSVYSMLLPAMLIGPAVGWIIIHMDRWLKDRIPVGLELLCYNVAAGAVGVILSLACYLAVSHWFVVGMEVIHHGAELLLLSNYLPGVALFIEPGKVLFLNNIINHGILEPLGIQQTKEFGHSVFFLMESNPGPGLGLLLAYYLHLKDKEKDNVRSSLIIHFIGGIHEVYFPYAMLRPLVIIPLVAAGMAGDWVFQLLHAGLVATPSPGSIIVLMLMAPKGMQLSVVFGVLVSAAVSFLGCYAVLWRRKSSAPVPQEAQIIITQTVEGEIQLKEEEERHQQTIRKIYFACDAGMGSSAMGAALLRKKIKQAGLPVEVGNCSVDEIPSDADLVISQEQLTLRAQATAPYLEHLAITSFVDTAFYDNLINRLQNMRLIGQMQQPEGDLLGELFSERHVMMKAQAGDKWQAIRQVGELLVRLGLVHTTYIDSMLQRERMLSTYVGNGVAIPHGIGFSEQSILKPGIVIAQYPDGVAFDFGQKAYLLVAVVGGTNQIGLVSRIAFMIEDPNHVKALVQADQVQDIVRLVAPFLDETAKGTK